MNKPSLNIYIVDDDEGVRRSLVMLLHAQGHALQAFASGESFLEKVDAQQPGCVILDLRLGGISGIEVFDQLLARRSPLVVLFLSGHGDIELAIEQVKKGAFDWIEKPNTPQVQAKIGPAMDKAALRAMAVQRWQSLTSREQEVAPLLARGSTSKAIARQLLPECDFRTVENHRARVFEKLQVGGAAELHGWIAEQRWLMDSDR